MEYSNLVSISGLSGLFEMVASKTDGAIVKSLEDQTTKFVSSRVHNFSHLESIEVYTVRDNINLVELFQTMSASKEALPSEKTLHRLWLTSKKYMLIWTLTVSIQAI